MAYNVKALQRAIYSGRKSELVTAFDALTRDPAVNAGNKTGAVTLNAKSGSVQRMVLTGNVTGLTIQNPTDGQILELHIAQDATGSRTFVWGASVAGGPTLTTTASRVDVVTLRYRGDLSKWVVTNTSMNLTV